MDMKSGDDIYDNFRTYQRQLLKEYARCPTSSASGSARRPQVDHPRSRTELRRQIGEFLEIAPPGAAPAGRARAVVTLKFTSRKLERNWLRP